MLKAIIFDLDGTLVDSEWFHTHAWLTVLERHGKYVSEEEYLRTYVGLPGRELDALFRQRFLIEGDQGSLLKEKDALVDEWLHAYPLAPQQGARDAIEFIRDLGLKYCVASNSPRPEMMLKLEKAGLDDLFELIVSADDVKLSKPAPDIYLAAAAAMGIDPKECMAIEDTHTGLQAALNAGVPCLVVPTQYTFSQDFSGAVDVCGDLLDAIRQIPLLVLSH